jgi:hypothetical protein
LHYGDGSEERGMDLMAIVMTLVLSIGLGLAAARTMLSAVFFLMARPLAAGARTHTARPLSSR